METLVFDTTDPTFSGTGPSGTVLGGQMAGIDVSGVLKDATAGLKSYTLSVRNNATDAARSDFFCEAADPALAEDRWEDVEVMGSKATSIDIDRTLSVGRPEGAGATADERLCVLLTATDAAGSGNSKDFSVATFEVDWSAVAAVVVDASSITDAIAEAGTATFTVALSQRPTDTVTVAVGGAGNGLTVDMESLTFAPDNATSPQTVTITSAADENIVNESGTFTTTASGGGYDGVKGDPVKVSVNDPDVMLEIDDTSVTEGTVDTVTITVTRSDTVGVDAISVNYAGGTATSTDASEFTVAEGTAGEGTATITIPSGMSSHSLKVAITAVQGEGSGTDDDDDDSITVTLTSVPDSGDAFPTGGVTITIVDDDKT
ncbi:MAG: hypothetical protein F4Y33_15165 [Gemmatimonadales bacterium]|nr:hypothetical protein [Gemmatimonadales bacterium]